MPVKLYLQKQVLSQVWPVDLSLLTLVPESGSVGGSIDIVKDKAEWLART